MTVAQFSLDRLQELLTAEPLYAAKKQFGESGVARAKNILHFLKRCARYSTVNAKSKVTVFCLMAPDTLVDELRLQYATQYNYGVTGLGSISSLMVEIREDGTAFVWSSLPSEIQAIIEAGIVYRLVQSTETFATNGLVTPVIKVIEDSVSQFFINYFTDLRQALIAYRDSMARTSKCHLLREAWVDENRLFFVHKPEFRLRKSLHNYLYAYLRHDEIDLREEQNVDDSDPVDIKIVWRMENRSAIIEVKWIGKSLNKHLGKITADYFDSRARSGAKQLAEYLEKHRQEAAKEDTRGYLVVFDCRRYGLKATSTAVTKVKGLRYQNQEIEYKPEYHKTRDDFDEPIRMFLEPVSL
jgi:hypothetical protein